MNTPIKTAPRPQPHTPPRPQASPQPATVDSRPDNRSLATTRRAEPDRLRPAWAQSDPHDALNADGLFFSQLLIAPVSAEPDQSGFGGSGLSLLPPADGVPTQLIDELAERLPDHLDGPLSVTLLMPSLGKVQVNASKRDNQWTVELGFARRGVLKRLQPHQRACQQALADALGHDVELSFQEEETA